jgi:4-amino-4-deoxy-L-arabinose transferase-like glycosyltransferase
MDDVFVFIIGWFFRILYFVAIEGMFYQVFYYIGALPVWIITLGRLPTKAPTDLPKKDRRWYGLLGILLTVLMGWYGLSSHIDDQEEIKQNESVNINS